MSKVVCVNVETARLEEWPLSPGQVRAGQPRASGVSLHEGGNGSGCGVWECTPGGFDWAYDTNQSMCIFSGEAEIAVEGGERLAVGPGDAVFFPAGTRARWDVRKTVRKLYTLY